MNLEENSTRQCDCALCKTNEEMRRIANILPEKEREWLLAYHEAAFEMMAELELIRSSN